MAGGSGVISNQGIGPTEYRRNVAAYSVGSVISKAPNPTLGRFT